MGLKQNRKICMQGNTRNHNPNDSTTYYFGALNETPGNVGGIQDIVLPCRCKITAAIVYVLAFGVAGSTENITMKVRHNDTTDYDIETKGLDASKKTLFENYDMNIVCERGDNLVIKYTSPAWATNPTTVYYCVSLFGDVLE